MTHPPIPDEVERAANVTVVEALIDELEQLVFTAARDWQRRITIRQEDRDVIVSALRNGTAHRLEARGEISEAMVERAARAGYERRIREQFHCEPGQSWIAGSAQRTFTWEELPDVCKDQERAVARAALAAALSAHETKEGANDGIT